MTCRKWNSIQYYTRDTNVEPENTINSGNCSWLQAKGLKIIFERKIGWFDLSLDIFLPIRSLSHERTRVITIDTLHAEGKIKMYTKARLPKWFVANCISIPSCESEKGGAITPALLLPG